VTELSFADPGRDAAADTPPQAPQPRARRRTLGISSVVLALVLAAVEGVAVYVATTGDFVFATVLAQTAVLGTLATLVLGLVASVTGRGRRWGIVGAVLSILVNPFVLTRVLDFFG
jgi:hypothetical protein